MSIRTLKTKKGTVEINKARVGDLGGLVSLYKAAFPVHTIFKRSEEAVADYLHRKSKEYGLNGFVVARTAEEEEVVGGILLRKEHQDGTHTRWKYNHVAVHQDYQRQGIGTALLEAADGRIRNFIEEGRFNSAKIVVTVAETEEPTVEFYVDKCGFLNEGILYDHYRLGEDATILGKTIQ